MKRTCLHSLIELLEPRVAPATLFVTNLNDTGLGSLRDAVAKANMTPDLDTILFKTTGMIYLPSGHIDVTTPVTIKGPGAGKLIINNAGGHRAFNVADGDPAKESPFSLSGISIVNGNTNNSGGAILSTESVTLTGVILSGNDTTNGGGIRVNGSIASKVVITSCIISGNTATGDGGGINIRAGAGITITKTIVSGNSAQSTGGGALLSLDDPLSAASKITVTGCTFLGDTQLKPGGGGGSEGGGGVTIRASQDVPVLISSSRFTGNSSQGNGGGLLISGGNVTVTGCTFSQNTAGTAAILSSGGGVAVFGKLAKFTKVQLIGNTAANQGGGLFFDGGPVNGTLTFSGVVSGNRSTGVGGGLCVTGGGTLSIQGATITANHTENSGGGVASFGLAGDPTTLKIAKVIFSDNSALASGGGLWAASDGTASVIGSKFLGNTTPEGSGGGALLSLNGESTITSTTFQHNFAAFSGGGLSVNSFAKTTMAGLSFVENIAGQNGGGLLVGNADAALSASKFTGNLAQSGGGINLQDHILTISKVIVTNNMATLDGGGIFNAGGTLTKSLDTKIFANIAPNSPDSN